MNPIITGSRAYDEAMLRAHAYPYPNQAPAILMPDNQLRAYGADYTTVGHLQPQVGYPMVDHAYPRNVMGHPVMPLGLAPHETGAVGQTAQNVYLSRQAAYHPHPLGQDMHYARERRRQRPIIVSSNDMTCSGELYSSEATATSSFFSDEKTGHSSLCSDKKGSDSSIFSDKKDSDSSFSSGDKTSDSGLCSSIGEVLTSEKESSLFSDGFSKGSDISSFDDSGCFISDCS